MKIGFIGAGRMGRPLVHQLGEAGHECTVLVRRPQARAALEAEGLPCTLTMETAVADADAVFVVVLTDDQVRSVCLGPDGALAAMQAGARLVQHTTCDPATVELIGAQAAEKDIAVLDAALSGGPHDIAARRLTLWVGGDEAVLAELRPVLETYASPIMPVGPLGNGQRVKLINNALFVAQVGLAVDAVRLGASLGVDEQLLLAALPHGSGASRGLSAVAGAGSVEAVGAQLSALMRKDLAVVRDVAGRLGANLGIIGTVLSSKAVEETVLRSGANLAGHDP